MITDNQGETPETDEGVRYIDGLIEVADVDVSRSLERRLHAAEKDARRYRWLRDVADRDQHGHCHISQSDWILDADENDEGIVTHWLQGGEADAAIDAEIDK